MKKVDEDKSVSNFSLRLREQQTFMEVFWKGVMAFHLPLNQLRILTELDETDFTDYIASFRVDSPVFREILLVLLDPNLTVGAQTEELYNLHMDMCSIQQSDKFYQERKEQLMDRGVTD